MASPWPRSVFICLALSVTGISDIHATTVQVEVSSSGHKALLRSSSLERHAALIQDESAALGDVVGEVTKSKRPPFSTTFSTCDGTEIPCTTADPCSSSDSCLGVYHSCGGKYTQCMLLEGTCKTPPQEQGRCYLQCQGYFVERFTHNTTNVTYTNPECKQLDNRTCQNSYTIKKEAPLEAALGVQCKLKKRRTCVDEIVCAMQNPPASLGPPSSWYEGPSNDTNGTNGSNATAIWVVDGLAVR